MHKSDTASVQGGMKAWASSGLLVKESTEYDASTFDGLNDTVQGRLLPTFRYCTS